MNIFWTKHIQDSKEKQDFKEYIVNSKPLLDRALAYVHHKAESVYPNVSDYSNPNWEYRQADNNGYLRALSDIEAFLNVYNNKASIKSTWLTKTNNPKHPTFFKRIKKRLLK